MNTRIKRLTLKILAGGLLLGSGCPLVQFFQPVVQDGIRCDIDGLDVMCEFNFDFDD